jgi:uncharacterized integral membrane protein
MHKNSPILNILLALFLLSLASEQSLKAYADPGSGAMIVQIILATIVGGLFRFRKFIGRFRRRKTERVGI